VGQAGKVDRNGQLAAENFSVGEHEGPAVLQPYAVVGHGADADLRAGQVLENGDLAAKLAFKVADLTDDAVVKGVIAVAKIEPRHVHAGADQSGQHMVR